MPPRQAILSSALKLLIENGVHKVASAVDNQECPAELAKCWGQTERALDGLLAVVDRMDSQARRLGYVPSAELLEPQLSKLQATARETLSQLQKRLPREVDSTGKHWLVEASSNIALLEASAARVEAQCCVLHDALPTPANRQTEVQLNLVEKCQTRF